MKKKLAFDVVVQKDESGGYVAFVPSLPGCHTQGDTLEELMKNVEDAIELYLDTLEEEEKSEAIRAAQSIVGLQRVEVHA
ncbi:MAG: type II toxin-antitoxin system HicB family antitoxin [Candidatus Hadarchaeales archaeon]